MRNGKGLANGVKKEVFVFVFDVRSSSSPFYSSESDRKRRAVMVLNPDFVARGSEHHCGKEIARRCFKLGFSSVANFLEYAREANFSEANVQAEVLQKKMDSFKDNLDKVLQTEVK